MLLESEQHPIIIAQTLHAAYIFRLYAVQICVQWCRCHHHIIVVCSMCQI